MKRLPPGAGGRNSAPPAFTLVELLISISVVALLAGMLLPGLNRAREQGKSANCRSNLRMLVQANLSYAGEQGDWFVPYSLAEEPNATGQLWLGYQTVAGDGGHGSGGATSGTIDFTRNPLLGTYFGGRGAVAVCPAERGRVPDLTATDYGGGYGYNALGLGRYISEGQCFRLKAGAIRNAARLIMFADNARTAMGPFSFDPPQLAPYLYCREKPALWGGEYASGTTAGRHTEKANAGWSDGHVTAQSVTLPNSDDLSRKYRVGHLGTRDSDPYRAEF